MFKVFRKGGFQYGLVRLVGFIGMKPQALEVSPSRAKSTASHLGASPVSCLSCALPRSALRYAGISWAAFGVQQAVEGHRLLSHLESPSRNPIERQSRPAPHRRLSQIPLGQSRLIPMKMARKFSTS